MASKAIELPLAVIELDSIDSLLKQFPNTKLLKLSPKNLFQVIQSDHTIQQPILYVSLDSAFPFRVFVYSDPKGKALRKTKKCCDKQCSGCKIPLLSSYTLGYFIAKRLLKRWKKEKWKNAFLKKSYSKALQKLHISPYNFPSFPSTPSSTNDKKKGSSSKYSKHSKPVLVQT